MSASFLEDDLDAILSEKDFGVTGGITWLGVQIPNAIFDDDMIEVSVGEGLVELVKQTVIIAKESDFTGIKEGDAISVSGTSYTVAAWKLESGMIEVIVKEDRS